MVSGSGSLFHTFQDVRFEATNAGAIAYTGCQFFHVLDCYLDRDCGPAQIAAANYIGPNDLANNPALYPTPGLLEASWCNGSVFERVHHNGGEENPAFDAWFQNSILQPTLSTNGLNPGVFPYAVTEDACKPSKWSIFYNPARNHSVTFRHVFRDLDIRGSSCSRVWLPALRLWIKR